MSAAALSDLPEAPLAIIWGFCKPAERAALVTASPSVFGPHVSVATLGRGSRGHPLSCPRSGFWKFVRAFEDHSRLADLDLGTFLTDASASSVLAGVRRLAGVRKLGLRVQHATDVGSTVAAIARAFPSIQTLRLSASTSFYSPAGFLDVALRACALAARLRNVDVYLEDWSGDDRDRDSDAAERSEGGAKASTRLESIKVRVRLGDSARHDDSEPVSRKRVRDAFETILSVAGGDSLEHLEFDASDSEGQVGFQHWGESWPEMRSLATLSVPSLRVGRRSRLWAEAGALRDVRLSFAEVPCGSHAHLRSLTLTNAGLANAELFEAPPGDAARAFTSGMAQAAPSIERVVVAANPQGYGRCFNALSSSIRWGTSELRGVARRVEFERRRTGWFALYTMFDATVLPYVLV